MFSICYRNFQYYDFFSGLATKSMFLGINCNKLYFDCYRTQNLKGPISSVTVSLRSKHIRAVSEQRTRSETQTPSKK